VNLPAGDDESINRRCGAGFRARGRAHTVLFVRQVLRYRYACAFGQHCGAPAGINRHRYIVVNCHLEPAT